MCVLEWTEIPDYRRKFWIPNEDKKHILLNFEVTAKFEWHSVTSHSLIKRVVMLSKHNVALKYE